MNQAIRPEQTGLPSSIEFRDWLQRALVITGYSATRLAHETGRHRNSIGGFLRDPERQIMLDNARALISHLRTVALEKGLELPPVPRLEAAVGTGGHG